MQYENVFRQVSLYVSEGRQELESCEICPVVVCCVFLIRSVQIHESVDRPSVEKLGGMYAVW
jgi:hypothetical protein